VTVTVTARVATLSSAFLCRLAAGEEDLWSDDEEEAEIAHSDSSGGESRSDDSKERDESSGSGLVQVVIVSWWTTEECFDTSIRQHIQRHQQMGQQHPPYQTRPVLDTVTSNKPHDKRLEPSRLARVGLSQSEEVGIEQQTAIEQHQTYSFCIVINDPTTRSSELQRTD
jgi:hypothetical protein